MQTLTEVRRQFLLARSTQENRRGDFSDWHRGRPAFWVWALDVDRPAVRARVAQAAQSLEGLLLEGYRRAPHITLGICGFPSRDTEAADSFTPLHLGRQLAALGRLRPAALTLSLGAAASFPSAPFLHVTDPHARLAPLRACLGGPCEALRRNDFLPHVTLGLYAAAWDCVEVARRLDRLVLPPLRLQIGAVSLMRYEAADIGGPLDILADYFFDGRGLRWRSGRAPEGFDGVSAMSGAGTMPSIPAD